MEEPKYELSRVFKLIKDGTDEKIDISLTRALRPVITCLNVSAEEAKEFILEQILLLTVDNFSSRIWMEPDVYDIYGKKIDGISWFIKFCIYIDENGDNLYCISFHPIEKNLTTRTETLTIN